MTKLRRNHINQGRGKGSSFMGRIIVVTILLIVACVALTWMFLKGPAFETDGYSDIEKSINISDRFYLPEGGKGELVHHKYYSLSYIEKHEQAEWVAYELTESDLRKPKVPRSRDFRPDYSISSGSAFHRDYTRSGFTRGHLAPAGDMAFEATAMKESFYMSNMSPQIRAYNNGIWRELEENVRDWAFDHDHLYIVTGPFLDNVNNKIGKNKVSVPNSFFKIILDLYGDEYNMIAFIIPHEKSEKHLREYIVSVDKIEEMTGFDFFSELLEDDIEENLEQSVSYSNWNFDEKKFKQRINNWNQQK